jgi:heme/copper-type cytochrome/quinol oxidase subunit 1
MRTLTRWFIKTSFVYFILALLVGVMLGAVSIWDLPVSAAKIYPSYLHLMVEGWITMLIIGVAIWMFPKFSQEKPHGDERLGWACYVLLNTGLLLRIISEPQADLSGSIATMWAAILTLAALLQWLCGMAFVINAWGRVKVK